MKRIGVLYIPERSDSAELARRVVQLLDEKGLGVWQGPAEDEEGLRKAAGALDLLITLGGDGTIVRAVRTILDFDLPILGVNLGTLGFLTEVEPDSIEEVIGLLPNGDYRIEERMMLHATLYREGQVLLEADALNDLVMARGAASRTVRVSIEVDGHHMMTPSADGVILSTPTGSTAYCLAAGGPIMAPDVEGFVVTPIAAHLCIAPAFVIPARRHPSLTLIKGEGAILTVDGHLDTPLQQGDTVYGTISDRTAKFVRFGSDGCFYESVMTKLRWPQHEVNPEDRVVGKC
ncbi:MAG: NAD(+)/NADH kinase [Chloroflexota bacterium]|nr:NAD(+)/NADH kinase [Chloroflexota bacterium]